MSVEPRLSFGRAVDAYERARPQYAHEAVAYLGSRLPMRRVLDLGAGTGKLTRQLVPVAESVVAVEPDDDMRAMLERVLPDVESLAGSAEAIPLPDGSVDVVTVAQAFHWFELEAALAEMHRVLRADGGIALLWNEYDWPELNAIVTGCGHPPQLTTTRTNGCWRHRALPASRSRPSRTPTASTPMSLSSAFPRSVP